MKLKFILVWISVLCGIMLHAQKFAILSDIHVTPGNANETKLKAAVEEINSSDVDYVLITGDLTNEGSDEQLRNVKSIFDRITKPQYVIPGNHENHWESECLQNLQRLVGGRPLCVHHRQIGGDRDELWSVYENGRRPYQTRRFDLVRQNPVRNREARYESAECEPLSHT